MESRIGDRITIWREGPKTIIKIDGRMEDWMMHAIAAWDILWTAMGGYVIYYLISGKAQGDQMIFFLVYLAFWLYFEYKGIEAFVYKLNGYERIEIDRDTLSVTTKVFGTRTAVVEKKDVQQIRRADPNRKSIWAGFDKSFWVVGNQQVIIDAGNKLLKTGMHLDSKDAESLARKLRYLINR